MRSLTFKLTLAFLLVSLIAIGLAAIFVWTTTSTHFNQYLVDQRQSEFVAIVTEYYQANGNWAGVDAALRSAGLLPPFVEPVSTPPDPQPFALVDQNRVVIIPGGEYEPGQKVQKGVLAKGIGIEINGLVVGTVLTTGETPIPSVIEEKYITSVNQSLMVAALGGAVVALLLGLFIARTLTRPVRDLTTAAQAMARGELEQQFLVRSRDELGELTTAFNQMSADLTRSNQLRRQMTADIAHDLRTPMTVLAGYLESLREGVLKPTPERFDVMQQEAQHLQHLVDDLRTLSLADAGELSLNRQPIPPHELLEQLAAAYKHIAGQRNLSLQVRAAPDLPELQVDVDRMR
jgi:signal transduction histidine kinase